ncbi:MAG TPA: hypothetical protein VFK84_14075 [Burkholderiales bacterium]|nr:hypothetical protein [Burkholderiales bacterium]
MRAALLAVVALTASCATPGPEQQALEQLLGPEARSYSLVGVENGIARFEKPLSRGAVTRTQMAVCRATDNTWRCRGPFEAARVSTPRSVQRLAAPREIEDRALQRVVAYMESDCFERQLAHLGRIADRRVTAVDREAGYFEVALGGPLVVDVLMIEPADDLPCGFEVRRHRRLTLD